MAYSYVCLVLQRAVVPLVLVLAALLRPTGISFVYLLMFFVCPHIPVASIGNFRGSVVAYLIILVALSTIISLCHIGLIATEMFLIKEEIFTECTFLVQILRHVGFIGFKNLGPAPVLLWVLPEFLTFTMSITVYTIIKKLTRPLETQIEKGEGNMMSQSQPEDDISMSITGTDQPSQIQDIPKTEENKDGREIGGSDKSQSSNDEPNFERLRNISPAVCLAALFFAACLRPSVPGGFYLVLFLAAGTYWAAFRSLKRKFASLLRLLIVVVAAHGLCIVAYQTPWLQEHIHQHNLLARLLCLEPLIISNCQSDIRVLTYNKLYEADSFLSPVVIFFTYYVLALTGKNLSKDRDFERPATTFGQNVDSNSSSHKKRRQLSLITQKTRLTKRENTWNNSHTLNLSVHGDQKRFKNINHLSESTPLMRAKPLRSYSTRRPPLTGVRFVNNDIPLESMDDTMPPDDEATRAAIICEQILYAVNSIGSFIYQNSYIFTNVLMMVWSIVYHSWLTFVLLLWANVLWMVPNQRKAMMRSSLFIVIYAEILILAQYIYGMDLTSNELPVEHTSGNLNFEQIGLDRPQEKGVRPIIPLVVKTSFLLMFWVTMRQFFKEKVNLRHANTLADVFATLQLAVTGRSMINADYQYRSKKSSKMMKAIGTIIKNFIVRLWIWIMLMAIFVCAMYGSHMTGFRICYMALFLFFLLVLQASGRAWIRIMYGFWLFLIFYAMFILTIIYTYQFDKFDQYWMNFLTLSPSMQADIGLHRYKTKDLFLHLLPPTAIIILTVIQVHYFHTRLVIATSNQPPLTEIGISRTKFRAENRSSFLYIVYKRFVSRVTRLLKALKDVFWRLLEVYWIKLVYIMAFACAAKEQSILNLPLFVLTLVGSLFNTTMKLVIMRIISLVVAIIVLSKMIYQVAFVDHGQYDVYCVQLNSVHNNALWFGLNKATKELTLMKLLKRHILYMVVATLQALITIRQNRYHYLMGKENVLKSKLAFPEIKREDAEVNLKGLLKYLANFGFYKFGYEISLIALVSTMAFRRDIIAMLYSLWLVLLVLVKRRKCARFWIIFQIYIFISLLLQYIFLVGVPPSLCLNYPWEESLYVISIQNWAMLPGELHFDHSNKLIMEFLLLLVVNRQWRVFKVENIPNYPGGSNKSVVTDIENLGKVDFQNPTHDFLTHMRNYLDVFKNAILCSFYWITLAVVFLAGTQISDFLGIGYLVGAFVFLWEGSDFYLRPIKSILTRWRFLLAFNVANIVIKTWLQMGGCLFMEHLTRHSCWLVHVLGINCASSQVVLVLTDVLEDINGCPLTAFQSVLLWDAICFAFLIFQFRIFRSHYFCHIINDTRANNILASRGAEIIERFRQKQIQKRQEHEEHVLQKIKRKMEKIRAAQQKMLRPLEKPTHFDDHGNPVYVSKHHKGKPIKTHPNAVRAGDYYMFEDVDEKFELDIIPDTEELLENDNENITESELKMNRRKTMHDEGQKIKTKEISASETTAGSSTSQKQQITSSKNEAKIQIHEEESEDSVDFESNPIIRLLETYLVALTIRLNRFSRNYRYVNKILQAEKKALKESQQFYVYRGPLSSRNTVFLLDMMRKNSYSDSAQPQLSALSPSLPPQSQEPPPSDSLMATKETQTTRELETESSSEFEVEHFKTPEDTSLQDVGASNKNKGDPNKDLRPPPKGSDFGFEEDDFTTRDHHIIIEVLISAWYAILSNTDLICYIWVFIHQVVHASLLSLPIPLMVFLWGTLSVPRPSKTFWVTLIAYTQAGVLIKCIFQFKLIWANYHYSLPNNPLGVEKLFGVQMDPNYATYDLILLLLLFFHRFILKSHGLWKTDDTQSQFLEGRRLTITKSDEDLNTDDMSYEDEDYSKISGKSNDETGRNRYLVAFISFFTNMVKKARLPVDVYALMFFCDFINFFVLLFGFTAFSHKHTEDGDSISVQDYLAENKVPVPFLIMLLVQFILIVIDRALYLRKAVIAKIIFHFISVIGIHVWMFFVVPLVTEKSFYTAAPPVIFYIMKCFYLLLSAYQIRCGYPKRISGNFFTKSFSAINMIAFKIYLLIPFLYELRTILDWLCTETTFTLFDWLKMEDIFANIYLVKCVRQMEMDFPAPRAVKKDLYLKILMGGTAILIIVALIWGPLTLFALFHAVGQPNTPIEISVQLRISSYDAIYTATTRDSTHIFDKDTYQQFMSLYLKEPNALSFLHAYDPVDVAAIKLTRHSSSMWDISPPDKSRLIQSLKNDNETIIIRFTYTITRKPPSKMDPRHVGNEVTFHLNETFVNREDFIQMLEGNKSIEYVLIPQIMPKFIKVINTGEPTYVPMLMHGERFRGVKLVLNRDSEDGEWWEIVDYCGGDDITTFLMKIPYFDCTSGIVFYTFNDKKFPQTWTFLTAGGIIGLYTTFVLVASRVIKGFSAGYLRRIMYEDLPCVDRILQLCLDVYLVREAMEFVLEEDLFAKLLFLYRSPETMIKWSRPRDEVGDDEIDTESVRSRGIGRREEYQSQ